VAQLWKVNFIVKDKGYDDIVEWYENSWRSNKKYDFSGELRIRLSYESDESRILGLREALQFELIRHAKYLEAIDLLKEDIDADPKNSLPRVMLAEHFLYYIEDPKTALQKIEEAILYAAASGEFIRNAFQVKARILRKLEDYEGLSKCMREIMKIENVHPELDAAKEADFLDRLPDGVLSQDLLGEYATFLSRGKR
jgi:hypothetical protein